MRNPLKLGGVALAASLLVGSVPALAQGYDGYGYGYGYGGPAPLPPLAYRPYNGEGYGRYYPHQETFVGPYGDAHRRCRPHKACYEGPNY